MNVNKYFTLIVREIIDIFARRQFEIRGTSNVEKHLDSQSSPRSHPPLPFFQIFFFIFYFFYFFIFLNSFFKPFQPTPPTKKRFPVPFLVSQQG